MDEARPREVVQGLWPFNGKGTEVGVRGKGCSRETSPRPCPPGCPRHVPACKQQHTQRQAGSGPRATGRRGRGPVTHAAAAAAGGEARTPHG